MKAIETHYNGYRFRSRLEARWAVFFDTLGIQYFYEHEGYNLDGVRYLPDFWIPAQNGWKEGFWIEIKAQEPTQEEVDKARLLAIETHNDVHICYGNIGMQPESHTLSFTKFGIYGLELNDNEEMSRAHILEFHTRGKVVTMPLHLASFLNKYLNELGLVISVSSRQIEVLFRMWQYGNSITFAIDQLEKFNKLQYITFLQELKEKEQEIINEVNVQQGRIMLQHSGSIYSDRFKWIVCETCKRPHLCGGMFTSFSANYSCLCASTKPKATQLKRFSRTEKCPEDALPLSQAYDAARSARFEFGEKPQALDNYRYEDLPDEE